MEGAAERQGIPVVAALLGPSLCGYLTIRCASFASASSVFGSSSKRKNQEKVTEADLVEKVGRLTVEVDWLKKKLKNYGTPKIFNSEQGVQFTSEAFTGLLLEKGITISMDGKGRVFDNIFTERFWRNIKYEWLYLNSFDSIKELRSSLVNYMEFYNEQRNHQSLNYKTPNAVYSRVA